MRKQPEIPLLFALLLLLSLALAACGAQKPADRDDDPVPAGTLVVTVSGLPGTVAASVSVSGPADFQRSLTASATLDGLTPGSYAVTAAPVPTPAGMFDPTVSGSPAAVTDGGSATVTVTYTLRVDDEEEEDGEEEEEPEPETIGFLQVTITGLPAGVPAAVTLSGPAGFEELLTASRRLALEPGTYTLSVAPVVEPSRTYGGSAVPASVTVATGTEVTSTVTYAEDGTAEADDGDTSIRPAVEVVFNPSGTKAWRFEAPLFNEEVILVRGLQYANRVSLGDPSDWLMFGMQPGDSPTQTLSVRLDCSPAEGEQVTMRIRDEAGDQLSIPVHCGGSHDFRIPAARSTDRYLIEITTNTASSIDYVLSLNAFCFGGCEYELLD